MDLVIQAPEIAASDVAAIANVSRAAGVRVLDGGGHQAYRLVQAERNETVEVACTHAGCDWAFVPLDQALERVRLVAMDMDSTLITIECIDEIADLVGIKPMVAAITASAMRGELDFPASLARRVALLEGVRVSALQRIYDERLRLSPGAERMLARFKAAGAKTLLVSGGFTFFTERLKQRLGLDHTLANVLEVRNGRLTGRVEGPIVDAAAKAAKLAALRDTYAGEDGLAVAIGDGANDVPMLEAADISVAYRAKPVVRAHARYAINVCGLDAVVNLFV